MKLEVRVEFEGDSEEEILADARLFFEFAIDKGFFERLKSNGRAGVEVQDLPESGKGSRRRQVRAEIEKGRHDR